MIRACLLLLLLFVGPSAMATQRLGDSPHGKPEACTACHLAGASQAEPGAHKPVTKTCLSCHPDADMHPVGMAPDAQHPPEGWPLEDGLLTCATCHAEPSHPGQSELERPWHREGPYEVRSDFCYKCHSRKGYNRSDPHHPETRRSNKDPTCAACHRGPPEPGSPPRQAKLRYASNRVCVTCHVANIHLGAPAHIQQVVPEDKRGSLPPELALLDGQIMCWTCHEVHDPATEPKRSKRQNQLAEGLRARVLERNWGDLSDAEIVWPSDGDPEHPRLLALPIRNGELCRACHGNGPAK